MNKKATFSPHILSLSAIFILGQGVLIFPLMGTDEFGFSAYLIAVVGIMIFYPVISFLWNKINGGNIVFSLILLAVSVFSLFTASGTFKEIVDFVSKIILPDTSKFFISVILGIVVICFSLKPHESLLKFSLVSLVIIIGVILFYFTAQADKYELRNIYIFRLPNLKTFIPQIKVYCVNPILQSLLLPIFLKFFFDDTRTKQGFSGVIIGACLLGMCILSPILLFGAQLSGQLDFPNSYAVSTVTVGRLFTRLDGFAYFVYFVSSVIKITVCISVVRESLKTIDKSLK